MGGHHIHQGLSVGKAFFFAQYFQGGFVAGQLAIPLGKIGGGPDQGIKPIDAEAQTAHPCPNMIAVAQVGLFVGQHMAQALFVLCAGRGQVNGGAQQTEQAGRRDCGADLDGNGAFGREIRGAPAQGPAQGDIYPKEPACHAEAAGQPDPQGDLSPVGGGLFGDGDLDLLTHFRQKDLFGPVCFQKFFVDLRSGTAGLLDLGVHPVLHFRNENGCALRDLLPEGVLVKLLPGRPGDGTLGDIGDGVGDGLGLGQNAEVQLSELDGHQQPQGYQQPNAVDKPAVDFGSEQEAQDHDRKDHHRGGDEDLFHWASSSAFFKMA